MGLSSDSSSSPAQPGRHVGDPRDKMRIPRKPDVACSPQDPAVRSNTSLPPGPLPIQFKIESSPCQPGTPVNPIKPQPIQSNQPTQLTKPQQPKQQQQPNRPVSGQQAMLPPGLIVPPGIDPSILLTSDHALTLLKRLPTSQQQAALLEFQDAMKNKGNRVRNTQAYLVGVIKRYITVTRKEEGAGAPIMGNALTPVVKVTLQKLIDSKFCTPNDLGDKVITKMKMLSERDAILAIEEIAGVERDKIRNFSSYFMGILNRYMRGEETPQQHRSQHAPSSARLTSRENDSSKRLNDRRGIRSHRDDDRYHESPSDRRRRSRSSDSEYDDKMSRRRRGKHRGRGVDSDDDRSYGSSSRDFKRSRRNRGRSRSRSWSRDRYDERRDRDRGRHDRRRRYRSRSYSRSRSRSPEYRRDRYRSSYRSSRRSDKGDHQRTSNGIVQKNMKHMPPLQLPTTMPGPYPSSIPPPPPPPPPPPRNIVPSGDHSGWQNLQPSNGQIVQQFGQIGQHQHAFSPHQAGLPNPAPVPAPSFSNAHQSVVLQSNTQYGNSIAGPMTSTDILGIAEKAASAVQALTNAGTMNNMTTQQNNPTTMINPIPQTQRHTQPQIQSNPSVNDTGVTIKDLDPLVQIALQNLCATGYLDKEPGSNACRLLKKIPATTALHCLEKFSSCDVNTMRSKEGYMIGIVRKAVNSG